MFQLARIRVGVLVLLNVLAAFCGAEVFAGNPYKKLLPLTVWIVNQNGSSSGTGFVVRRNVGNEQYHFIMTNYHVVADEESPYFPGAYEINVKVFKPMYEDDKLVTNKDKYLAQGGSMGFVFWASPEKDLAMLYVRETVPLQDWPFSSDTFPLGEVSPGDMVYSLGNPGASKAMWNLSSGTVRQIHDQEISYSTGQNVSANFLETQAPINPGDSGGPIVNESGELVGVNALSNPRGSLISGGISASEVESVLSRAEIRGWYIAKSKEVGAGVYSTMVNEQFRLGSIYWAKYFAELWKKRLLDTGEDASRAENAIRECEGLEAKFRVERHVRFVNKCDSDVSMLFNALTRGLDGVEKWRPNKEMAMQNFKVKAKSSGFLKVVKTGAEPLPTQHAYLSASKLFFNAHSIDGRYHWDDRTVDTAKAARAVEESNRATYTYTFSCGR